LKHRPYGQYVAKRDRQWPSEEETTERAKQVWQACYGTPWPDGWRVGWRHFKRRYGDCNKHTKLIRLNWLHYHHQLHYGWFFHKQVLETLVHEFTHLRYPNLKHGPEFRRMILLAYERLVGPDNERLAELIRREARRKVRRMYAAEKAWNTRRGFKVAADKEPQIFDED
jgi:predicted metal-dependent hydrolase